MFVVGTVENLANSVGKLVCSEKSVGFDHLALAVNPLRFDGVQPRALLRKQATDDPYPLTALFDSAVVGTEPTPHLFGDVPTGVVPDENENLLANGFELSHAPLEKARRYRRNRPPVHEPDPRSICDRRMVKVSLERRPFWRLSRSSSDNGCTKIGVFMGVTVTPHPKPILKMH